MNAETRPNAAHEVCVMSSKYRYRDYWNISDLRSDRMLTTFTLCLMVGLSIQTTDHLDCSCDCQKLEIENHLMRLLIGQKQETVPELLASYDGPPTVQSSERAPTALWTESQIISTYKTLITSLAVTEVPIWFRNRSEWRSLYLRLLLKCR